MVAEIRTCQNPVCDNPVYPPRGYVNYPAGLGLYCSRKCAAWVQGDRNRARAAEHRKERAYAVSEVEFLIGTDFPGRLAHRLGYDSTQSLSNACRAEGRDDLANRLTRDDWPTNEQEE